MQIRHRHLGGGGEEDFPVFKPIHVLFELRELARTHHGVPLNQKRRADFQVVVLPGVEVEAEIEERPFQARTRPGETDKTAAADLGGAFQIEQAELGSQLHVIRRSKVESRLFTPDFHLGIPAGIHADGIFVVGQIGQLEQQITLGFIRLGGLFGEICDFLSNPAHLLFQFRSLFPLGTLHADLLAQALAVAVELLEPGFEIPSHLVARKNLVEFQMRVAIACGKPFANVVWVFPDKPDVEHAGENSGLAEAHKPEIERFRKRASGKLSPAF